MEILRVTLAAGERKSFHKSGRYFEVMKAAAPFDVQFTDRQIGVYPCIGLEAGVYSELPFQTLEVISAAAQTVTLMISDHKAGFRAGGSGAVETAVYKSGVAPAAGEPGWVSGALVGLAASDSASIYFDLGESWSKVAVAQISLRSDGVAPIFAAVAFNDTAALSYERWPNAAGSGVWNAAGVSWQYQTPTSVTVRPMGRFLSLLCTNTHSAAVGAGAGVVVTVHGA